MMDAALQLERVHWSDKRIKKLHDNRKGQEADDFKPNGLWYSVEPEDGWAAWCKAEDFRDTDSQVAHVLRVDASKILVIDSVSIFDDFDKEYQPPPGSRIRYGMDWKRLAERYDGIEIAPYQWSKRLGVDNCWYYGWDCASGCIWRPTTCVEIVEVRE